MELKRGDLITVALSGDFGKHRPALVIQSDVFSDLPSVVVLRLTSEVHDWPLFRVTVEPARSTGLERTSQVMIDKPAAVPKTRIGARIGRVDDKVLRAVGAAFARFYGFGLR